jgi:predicted negative regulator of RcsB-dependent stress response
MLNDMLIESTSVLLQVQAQTESADDANEVWGGWGSVAFVTVVAILIALVIAMFIWQIFRTAQVRTAAEASIAQETAYKTLAEQVVDAQTRTADELEQLRESLSDLRTRVATIERLLAEVG